MLLCLSILLLLHNIYPISLFSHSALLLSPKSFNSSFTGLRTTSLYLQLSFPSTQACHAAFLLPLSCSPTSISLCYLPTTFFSKSFYFFLPSNNHKSRPNPHRSRPVRTNVIRIHHSLFNTVSLFITTPNNSGRTRAGPDVQLAQHDYSLHSWTGSHLSLFPRRVWKV